LLVLTLLFKRQTDRQLLFLHS